MPAHDRGEPVKDDGLHGEEHEGGQREAKQRHAVAGNRANRHAGRHDQISGHQHAARTLFRPGETRQQDPASGGCDPRDGGQQTDLQRSKLAPATDDPRQEITQAVNRKLVSKVNQHQQQKYAGGERCFQGKTARRMARLLGFFLQYRVDCLHVVAVQPAGVSRFIRQSAPDDERQRYRGQPFDKEHPLPAVPAGHSIKA